MVGCEIHINNFIGLKDIVIKFKYLTVLSGNQGKDNVLASLMVAFNNIIVDYEEGKVVRECPSFKKLVFLVGLDKSYDFEIKYKYYRMIAKDGVKFLGPKGKHIMEKAIMFNDKANELFESLYVKQNSGIEPNNTFCLDVSLKNFHDYDIYDVKTNVFNNYGWEIAPSISGGIVIDDPIVGKTIYASLLSSILYNKNYDTLFSEIAYSTGRCIVLNDIYKYFDDDTYQMLLERVLSFINSDSKNSIVITDSSNTISYYLNLYLEANNVSKQVGSKKVSEIVARKYWFDIDLLSYYYINEETGGLYQVKNKITNLLDMPQNCYVDDTFDKLSCID